MSGFKVQGFGSGFSVHVAVQYSVVIGCLQKREAPKMLQGHVCWDSKTHEPRTIKQTNLYVVITVNIIVIIIVIIIINKSVYCMKASSLRTQGPSIFRFTRFDPPAPQLPDIPPM